MKTKLIEVFGWYGTVAIVGAYALVSFEMMSVSSLTYQLLNITGAIGVGISAYHKYNYQSSVLELIWTLIGIIAIIKMFW